ncbi:MAG: hypothetical protein AB9891_12910 [Anaerolineaceae bacterium]
MPNIDEIRDGFSRKLDQAAASRKQKLAEEIQFLQQALPGQNQPVRASDLTGRINRIQSEAAARSQAPLAGLQNALVNITHSDPLRDLDQAFLKTFNLPDYYPAGKLAYPTIFCETLEEFFAPFLAGMNYSDAALLQECSRMMEEAQQAAEKGGGIFGVNFPGQGCYLNGWLVARLARMPAGEVMRHPEVSKNVLGIAAHEKLGHGFLSVYSTLGELKTRLGLSVVQIASQFGIAPADDAADRLRYEQKNLLFTVSQFLEEGWATWIEHYMNEKVIQANPHTRHSLENIVAAVQNFPRDLEHVDQIEQSFLTGLGILFSDEEVPMHTLLQAIKYLERAGLQFDDHFGNVINQPLRYALGELLCIQAAANLGEECLPYAILIAANVTFDLARISLADLQNLMFEDPRLNPDARFAAISRLKLDQPGNINELTQRVNSELSLSIPPELRKVGQEAPCRIKPQRQARRPGYFQWKNCLAGWEKP